MSIGKRKEGRHPSPSKVRLFFARTSAGPMLDVGDETNIDRERRLISNAWRYRIETNRVFLLLDSHDYFRFEDDAVAFDSFFFATPRAAASLSYLFSLSFFSLSLFPLSLQLRSNGTPLSPTPSSCSTTSRTRPSPSNSAKGAASSATKGKALDFFLVCEPEWLDSSFLTEAKKVKRPAVALVSTDATWITL